MLHPLDIDVPRGKILGLVGPGGVGKTLLLKMLCGLIRPDQGTVEVDGVDINRLRGLKLAEMRKRFGVLFQNYALFDFMTVWQNVAFPLIQARVCDETTARERAVELLTHLGLQGSEELMPNQLSGGMKKRVSLARATISHPEIMLCDDPTAGLDPVTSSKIFIMLKRVQQEAGSTTLVVTHDIDRLVQICDEYMMLYEGRVIFRGDYDQAMASEHPAVQKFFRG